MYVEKRKEIHLQKEQTRDLQQNPKVDLESVYNRTIYEVTNEQNSLTQN